MRLIAQFVEVAVIAVTINSGRMSVTMSTDSAYNPDAAEDLVNRATKALKDGLTHMTEIEDYTTVAAPLFLGMDMDDEDWEGDEE